MHLRVVQVGCGQMGRGRIDAAKQVLAVIAAVERARAGVRVEIRMSKFE